MSGILIVVESKGFCVIRDRRNIVTILSYLFLNIIHVRRFETLRQKQLSIYYNYYVRT